MVSGCMFFGEEVLGKAGGRVNMTSCSAVVPLWDDFIAVRPHTVETEVDKQQPLPVKCQQLH